ncbi:GIY-YIG nuclease family protein [Aeromicrobium piscarium]|nr:GIY-YIG nuclease family protein [Aeromicrobium piscarium]
MSTKDRVRVHNKGLAHNQARNGDLWLTRTCQLPNCDERAIRDRDGDSLGVCFDHGIAIWDYLDEHRATDILEEMRMLRRLRAAQDAEDERRRVESIRQAPGWIYYVLVGDRVKIGYSVDVKRRLRAYPPDSPLLAVHPGTKQLESEMHEKFAGSRAAGREWFLDTPEMRQHIAEVVSQFGEPDRARLEHRGRGPSMQRAKPTSRGYRWS